MSESAGAGDHCWPVTSNKCVPPSHDNLAAVCLFVSLVPAPAWPPQLTVTSLCRPEPTWSAVTSPGPQLRGEAERLSMSHNHQ